jgi:hypothetical protein
MITQKKDEPRLEYLLRVSIHFLREGGRGIVAEQTADYDETTCDGYCLADDLENELSDLQHFRENSTAIKSTLN